MRYAVPVAAFAALLACEAPSSPPELHPTLQSAHAWSRGESLVSDPAFRATTLPSVTLGSCALVVRAVDDTTIAVALPDTSGPIVLRLSVGETAVPIGPFVVAGFRDAFDGPYLSGYVLPWPPQNPVGVVGAGDSGAVIVDLRFNVVARAFPESVHSPDCAWGVGPSAFAGRVVFYGRPSGGPCGLPISWAIGGSLTSGDTLYGFAGTWALAELGRRRSLASSDTYLHLRNCDTTPCQSDQVFGGGGVTGVTLSPRGDRAALAKGGGLLPFVLETRNLTSAYSVSGMRTTQDAAFSANGDTLFVVGSDTSRYGRGVLAVLDATTGTVLTSVSLDSTLGSLNAGPTAIALDPLDQWIYVTTIAWPAFTAQNRALLIFDRRSLALQGVLRAPAAEDTYLYGFDRIVPMPAAAAIYVVATQQGYDLRRSRPRILRFDRLPDSP